MSTIDKKYHLIDTLFEKSMSKGIVKKEKLKMIDLLVHGASPRKYYRVTTNSMSYVVCLDEPFSKREYPFLEVQSFLNKIGVRVPHIYDVIPEDGYLLEEDLGDNTLLSYSVKLSVREELAMYKRCVDLLVKFQSTNLRDRAYSFQQLAFDCAKLNSEVAFSITHLVGFLAKDNVQKWTREIGDIRKDFEKINKIIAEKEMTFTHRDFHSRNIMIKDEVPIVIDFQDARMGLPQYDLVSLLDDCYYRLNHANKENIKKYYFGQMALIVNDQNSFSDFSYFYDLMCIQRVFKALGTFSFIFRSREDERYLKYIAFAFEKLREIMWKYKEFDVLRKNLAMIYYDG